MAIQKSITDEHGVTHSSAYVRIRSMTINYGKSVPDIQTSKEVIMGLEIFTNAAARSKGDEDNEKIPVIASQVAITGNDFATYFADSVLAGNTITPIKQGYTWLKTKNSVLEQNWTTGTTDV